MRVFGATDRRANPRLGAALCLAAIAYPGVVLAAPIPDDAAVLRRAGELQRGGQGEAARELLEGQSSRHPASELLVLARADSYLLDQNPQWAQKSLTEFIAAHPPACGARAMSARLQIDQANLELAEELLGNPKCLGREEDRARVWLLRAVIAELRGEHARVSELTEALGTTRRRYAEDDEPIQLRLWHADPYRVPLLSWSMAAGAGYARTGQGLLPNDLEPLGHTNGAGVASMNLRLRAAPQLGRALRLVAEGALRMDESWGRTPRAPGLRQPGGQLGLVFGREYPRLGLDYLYDSVWFSGGSGERGNGWYATSHGGRFRLMLGPATLGYAVVSHRRVTDEQKSGVESESGLSHRFVLSDTVRLETTTSVHAARTSGRAERHLGAGEFLGLELDLPKGFEYQETLRLLADAYPGSEATPSSRDSIRRELSTAVTEALLGPDFGGWRLLASYGYFHRESDAPEFTLSDHRVLLEFTYQSDSDRWAVHRVDEEGRIPLRHQELPEAGSTKDVRQMLRDDEVVKRSSSCLK